MFEYPHNRRKPFTTLLSLYLGKGRADTVLEEARGGESSREDRTSSLFYGHYYLGKYYEIMDGKDRALEHIRKALEHRIDHFMYACAEIDLRRLSLATKR